MLYQSGLLISDRPGQGPILQSRGRTRGRRDFRSQWLNPLAIRFRGIDPTRLFDVLYPIVRPFFSRAWLIASAVFILSAALLAAVRWPVLAAKLPTFEQFFTPGNLLLMTFLVAGIKVLHEFGHGLACRHFGGECRELGAMFLVFTPCLYCDVTDSWRFTSKWSRAAVSAAGIFVELNLAAAAMFVWWFSEPGLLNQVCLGVMTVASIGTIVFNGNPLMRYDGYYVLSDLVEVPSLSERAASVVRYYFSRYLLGLSGEPEPLMPSRNRLWYATFAIASAVYRWLVTFAIILFLVAAARPYRLESLARVFGMAGIVALVFAPLFRVKRFLEVPGSWQRMRISRLALSIGISVILLSAILLVPLPQRIFGPLEMQLLDPASIYVDVGGRVTGTSARYGRPIAAGDVLVRLENRDIDLSVEELTARRDRQRTELTSLRRQQFDDASAALSIPHSEKLLESLEEQLEQKLRDRARLTIASPRDGLFFPPSIVSAASEANGLPSWTGRPLDPDNHGCAVEAGVLLGQIGDPLRRQAAIVVDQEDVEFVKPGDAVEVLLDAFPDRVFHGRVAEVALGELRETPHRLSNLAGGEVSSKFDGATSSRPASTSYLVFVPIDDPDAELRIGTRGTARIHVNHASLGSRLWRRFSRTFHFHL